MKLLLDSQTFLWLMNDIQQLGREATMLLKDGSNQIYVSVVSIWELGLKNSKKAQRQPYTVAKMLAALPRMDLTLLELTEQHLVAYGTTKLSHKDPFDTLLVAQSEAEGAVFMTSDHAILRSKYKAIDVSK